MSTTVKPSSQHMASRQMPWFADRFKSKSQIKIPVVEQESQLVQPSTARNSPRKNAFENEEDTTIDSRYNLGRWREDLHTSGTKRSPLPGPTISTSRFDNLTAILQKVVPTMKPKKHIKSLINNAQKRYHDKSVSSSPRSYE